VGSIGRREPRFRHACAGGRLTGRFLLPSAASHELRLLSVLRDRGVLALPFATDDVPLEIDWRQVGLSNLIDEGLVERVMLGAEREGLRLSPAGEDYLRRLSIDFHLELLSLRSSSDRLFRDRVVALRSRGIRRMALYGASDTARVLLEFLQGSGIEVLAVVDDDPNKQGMQLVNVPIVNREALPGLEIDAVVVTTVAYAPRILTALAGRLPGAIQMLDLFDA
jgi:hypothetical protein